MFCPQCKTEYVDGIFECADCHVPLVDFLAESKSMPDQHETIEWVPLLTCPYIADLALIKSIFDGEKIRYWVQGELRGFMRGVASGAIIHVDKKQVSDAETLVRELDLNPLSYSIRKYPTT